ncbi:hypothetical protein M5D96_002900, partial [Drosophila gunungcola]
MEQDTAAGPAKKSGTTLSVDRAAFLLLRVRKVFKKKRQQRKERQAQQNAAAAAGGAAGGGGGVGGAGGGSGSQSRPGSRKLPPPLLRSRTLPAIIVPGLPVVSLHTDKQTFQLDVISLIPAPHVVAARAYRLAARKRASASSEASTPMSREHTLHEMPLAETASSGSGSGSGSSTTLTRLAKLLNQSSALASRSNLQPPPSGDNAVQSLGRGLGLGLGEEAPRRLSWERRKDSSALQRSASIDSFAEIVFSDSPRPSLAVTAPGASYGCVGGAPSPFSKRPSASSLYSTSTSSSFGSQAQAQLNVNYGDSAAGSGSASGSGPGTGVNGGSSASSSRRESMLSPSSTRRSKLTRIINGECGKSDAESTISLFCQALRAISTD